MFRIKHRFTGKYVSNQKNPHETRYVESRAHARVYHSFTQANSDRCPYIEVVTLE